MTPEEAELWGQNNHGIWATEAPELTDELIPLYLRGLYYCQDAGPVVLFESGSKWNRWPYSKLHYDIQQLWRRIGIETIVWLNPQGFHIVFPASQNDYFKIEQIVKGVYKE